MMYIEGRVTLSRALFGLSLLGVLALGVIHPAFALQAKKKAQKAGGGSSPQAKALFADAVSFQNNGAYELAAEEYSRFLNRFGKNPLAVKAHHYRGVCRMQLKKYPQAIEDFATAIKTKPDFEFAENAYLNLGWCRHSLGKAGQKEMHSQAIEAFDSLLEKFPKGKYVDQALYFKGESFYALNKLMEASRAYYKLYVDHPKSKLRGEAIYALGVTYEEQERFKDAGQVYDIFLRRYPQHKLAAEVQMRKAETVLQLGDPAGAAALFAEAAGREGFDLVDHALSRQAFCLAKQDKLLEAAEIYAKIADEYPQSSSAAEASVSAGRCFYQAGKNASAAKWFDKTIAGGGKFAPEAAHWRCQIYLAEKKPVLAEALAKKMIPKVIQGDGDFAVRLKMDLADAWHQSTEKQAASIDLYLRIAREHPRHSQAPQAQYNAAFGAMELKNYKQGLQYATAFLERFSKDALAPDVRYVQAECYLHTGQRAQAEKVYRDLLSQYPQHAEIATWRLRLAVMLQLQKKYDEVVAILKDSRFAAKRQQAEAQHLIGASQFAAGRMKQAQEAFTAALRADPQRVGAEETLLLLSRCQKRLGQVSEAVATADKIIAEYPKTEAALQAFYRKGEYLFALGQYQKSVEAYDQAIEQAGSDSRFAPYALYGKGWSLLKKNNHAASAEAFGKLLTQHARHKLAPDALLGRATAHRLGDQFDKAIEDVDAFLKTNPPLAQKSAALYERGLAQSAKKNFDAAASTFVALLKENPQYDDALNVLYELGWTYKSQNKPAEAAQAFGRLAKQHPQSSYAAEANFHVGEALYDQQKYDQAIEAYAKAAANIKAVNKGSPVEKAVHKWGWSHFQKNEYDQALEQFQRQLEHWPGGVLAADGRFMAAECLFRKKDYQQALTEFEKVRRSPLKNADLVVLALLHGGQSAAQTKQWAKSLEFYTSILKQHADSAYVAEAHYEKGFAHDQLGDQEQALKHFQQAVDSEFARLQARGRISARAYFMQGEIYFKQKAFAKAIEQFLQVMYRNYVDDVENWRLKSGFEAARCAEVQIADAKGAMRDKWLAKATEYYGWVVKKGPQSEYAAQSRKRLKALARLNQ